MLLYFNALVTTQYAQVTILKLWFHKQLLGSNQFKLF